MTRVLVRPGKGVVRTVKRRSIVEFERWLDGEIAVLREALADIALDGEALARRHATATCKLEAMSTVKERLLRSAFPPVAGTEEPEEVPE